MLQVAKETSGIAADNPDVAKNASSSIVFFFVLQMVFLCLAVRELPPFQLSGLEKTCIAFKDIKIKKYEERFGLGPSCMPRTSV